MKPAKRGKARARYHHGALREALIAAGTAVLADRGPDAFSLRETARRAGVSPAAPAHHFGDARGLLTAIAAKGFEALAEELAAARGETRESDLEAKALAYLGFARAHGAIFALMWRKALLNVGDPDYLQAGRRAFNVFERAATGEPIPVATAPHRPAAAVLAMWALIHGYAWLTLDGAIDADDDDLTKGVLATLAHFQGGRPAGVTA